MLEKLEDVDSKILNDDVFYLQNRRRNINDF